jgi:hypothetical protein
MKCPNRITAGHPHLRLTHLPTASVTGYERFFALSGNLPRCPTHHHIVDLQTSKLGRLELACTRCQMSNVGNSHISRARLTQISKWSEMLNVKQTGCFSDRMSHDCKNSGTSSCGRQTRFGRMLDHGREAAVCRNENKTLAFCNM